MLRAGVGAVRRYTGVVLTLYLAQAMLAIAAMLGVAAILIGAFGDRPLLDQAVDGDLVALVEIVRAAPQVVWGSLGVVVAIAATWAIASWLLTGGLLAVLRDQPDGRAATARVFGAGAVDMFLAFARLGLLSLLLHVLVVATASASFDAMATRLLVALSTSDLVWALVVGLAPPLLVRLALVTLADLARADLAARAGVGGRGVIRAYLRALALVLRRPAVTLGHAGLAGLLHVAILAGFAWLASGHLLLGAGGAITLFIVRQGVALLRLAVTVGAIAGQHALVRTLPPA
jgi:hypothetical protein